MVGLMVNPPPEQGASRTQHEAEMDGTNESLKRRATMLVDTLNSMEGITCNATDGALYVFPRIRLPAGAEAAAKEAGMAVDAFYALKLLEATGIVVVPGSGFGQKEV